jgi:2-dehydro-3-deoxyphosphogluconate aldolase / (4S)-4-hydroxy-2-oxoglutarate aldolase
MSEDDVITRLGRARVVPVASLDNGDQADATARALQRGGLDCIEITFRTAAAAEALRRARAVDGMLVGAGTVLSPEQAAVAADAGADFAVAPGTNPAVVEACRALGLPFFPGVATPSEIETARALGRTTLKLFPAAQVGGAGFLRAVSATYPDVRFLPTGGIGADSAADYLAIPSVLAVGGSWLVQPELLRAGRFDEVERLAREATGDRS